MARLTRYTEGWQPGLLAVFVAGISALLAVPRPVPPAEIPEPMLDPGELDRVARADRALAEAAERERRDTDVAALGEAIRAYGRTEIESARGRTLGGEEGAAVINARREVARAAALAAVQGEVALARLRAYQLRSFLRELHRWEDTGVETPELAELGGPFLADADRRGWVIPARRGGGGRLLLDPTVRAALFKKRWSELALAHGPAFDLTPAETRAIYRFLLLTPPREARPGLARNGAAETADDERAAFLAEKYRLGKIEELRALDPTYPADLAKGVVLYRRRSYALAADAFRRHLDAHPDGPWALRARNYLDAALEAP